MAACFLLAQLCLCAGDPETIAKVPGRMEINHLDGWANSENLQLLNLM